MVSREPEEVLHPVAERHLGVGVVPAGHQDQRVHEDQPVSERRQRKTPVRCDQDRHADEDWRDFKKPRKAVLRADSRQNETKKEKQKQNGGLAPLHDKSRFVTTSPIEFCWVSSKSVGVAAEILGTAPPSFRCSIDGHYLQAGGLEPRKVDNVRRRQGGVEAQRGGRNHAVRK